MTLADDELDAQLAELVAEALDVHERLVTAPHPGQFHPTFRLPVHPEGMPVASGQTIGVLFRSGEEHTVTTPFAGVLMGLLVLPGERVRRGQAVAWLRPRRR